MLTLSFLGMVQQVPSLIDSTTFPLPEGLSHEVLDPLLLAETAELEIMYPEPNTLAVVITAWATARGPAWGRMAAALSATYNPIHNYDRSESWTEGKQGSDHGQGTTAKTGSSTSSGTTGSTVTKDVAGYNSSAANVPKDKDTASGTSSGQISTGEQGEWSDSRTTAEQVTRSGSVSGNIGVTTSQQMIEAELELRKIDIYKLIIREFTQMFCLGVY